MKNNLLFLILFVLLLPFVLVGEASASGSLPKVPLEVAFERIASALFVIVLAISLVFLVYAAFLFVTAGGASEQVEKARNIILYVIVGLIVAALAWGIREFIKAKIGA